MLYWKSRVGRQCVERVKAFQNPTELIGQIVEMVMALIGKRFPTQRGSSSGGESVMGRGSDKESVLLGKDDQQSSGGRYSMSSGSTRTPGGHSKSQY